MLFRHLSRQKISLSSIYICILETKHYLWTRLHVIRTKFWEQMSDSHSQWNCTILIVCVVCNDYLYPTKIISFAEGNCSDQATSVLRPRLAPKKARSSTKFPAPKPDDPAPKIVQSSTKIGRSSTKFRGFNYTI